VKDLPLTLGLAAYLPGGYGAEYRLDHGIFGRQKYESEGMLLKVLPTAAFRFGKYVSIGGGLGFGYSTARFEVPYTFQTGAFAGQSAKVDLDTDAFGITGNFGIQVRPTDRLTIGASYISETLTEQDGDFKLDLSGGPLAGLFPDPSASYDAEFNLRWPRSAGLGVSYRFDDARLSVDGVWFNWQDAFDRFTLRLSDGDNAGINAFVGSDEAKDVFPLGWRDSYSVRVGYELRLLEDTTLRLGYVYNLNPIPKRTLTPLLPGTLEHSFSIGLGKRLGAFEVHVAYQYAFAREQHIEQSDLVGGDFDDSELDAQAHWGFVTLGARF
jgi:long-subunit fatty acid transport protein